MLTTQKLWHSKIPLTMKTATSSSFQTHFLIKLPSVKFLLKSLTSNKSILEQKNIQFRQGISVFLFPFSVEMK